MVEEVREGYAHVGYAVMERSEADEWVVHALCYDQEEVDAATSEWPVTAPGEWVNAKVVPMFIPTTPDMKVAR